MDIPEPPTTVHTLPPLGVTVTPASWRSVLAVALIVAVVSRLRG
jgi:hypothetical protein